MSRWALGSHHGWCWRRSCVRIRVISDLLANFLCTVAAWNCFGPTTNWQGLTRNATGSALRCSVWERRWKPTRAQTRREDTAGKAMEDTAGRSGACCQWHRCLLQPVRCLLLEAKQQLTNEARCHIELEWRTLSVTQPGLHLSNHLCKHCEHRQCHCHWWCTWCVCCVCHSDKKRVCRGSWVKVTLEDQL